MRFPRLRPLACLSLLLVGAGGLCAHDYWMEVTPAAPQRGEAVAVRVHVGDHLVSEVERKLQLAKTPSFRAVSAAGSRDLLAGAKDDVSPVVQITPEAGGNLLVMERSPTLITIEAKKFEAYLKEEGLERHVLEREKRDETEKAGRERYVRYFKAYFESGPAKADDETFRRVLGLKLEIVPEKNPLSLRVGEKLPVRVLFDGKPLANSAVFLFNRNAKLRGSQRATTDAEGRAEFVVYEKGLWLIRLVHMWRAPAGEKEVEWDSAWASYAFVQP